MRAAAWSRARSVSSGRSDDPAGSRVPASGTGRAGGGESLLRRARQRVERVRTTTPRSPRRSAYSHCLAVGSRDYRAAADGQGRLPGLEERPRKQEDAHTEDVGDDGLDLIGHDGFPSSDRLETSAEGFQAFGVPSDGESDGEGTDLLNLLILQDSREEVMAANGRHRRERGRSAPVK